MNSFTLDTLNNKLYGLGTNDSSQSIYEFNPVDNSAKPVLALDSGSSAMVYDSLNGNFYVASSGLYNAILVINGTSYAVVRNISLSSSPSALAFDPDNGAIYVAGYSSDVIWVINDSTNAVTAEINTTLSPSGFAYDSQNKEMYVSAISISNSSSEIVAINTATNSINATIPLPIGSTFITYDEANQDIYLASPLSNNITIVGASSNQIVKSVIVPYDPSAIAYNTNDLYVYVVSNATGGAISKIESGTDAVLNPNTGLGLGVPFAFSYDSSNGVLYLTTSSTVLEISTSTRSISCLSFNGEPTFSLSVSNPYLNASGSNYVSVGLTPSQSVLVYYNGTGSYLTSFTANPQWQQLSNGSWTALDSFGSTSTPLWKVSQSELSVTMNQTQILENQTGSFTFDINVGNLPSGFYGLQLDFYLEFSSYPGTSVLTVFTGYIPIYVF